MSASARKRAVRFSRFAFTEHRLKDDLHDRRSRNSEHGADDAEERAADKQRGDDDHRADANLPLHDLGNEQVILGLLLHDEKENHPKRRFRRDGERRSSMEI